MLRCVSLNHRNAPFEYLEQLAAVAQQAQHRLVARPDVCGVIVLSTCNRLEFYLHSNCDDVTSAVAEAAGVDVSELREFSLALTGEDVPRHLFSVASGLESVVVGEEEISGQVGRALIAARESGVTSSRLEKLFQAATKTSRTVKTRTALSVAGRSLVRLALELASSRVGDWSTRRIVLVGTGQYAATTLAALRERGATQLCVFSPSGRGEAFALSHGVRFVTDLGVELAEADLVITCTAVDGFVVAAADFDSSPCSLVIDLGLPRNVNPNVGTLDGVELLDLETVRIHAPIEELTSAHDARTLVGTAAAQFAAEQSVAPAVVALREHLLGVMDAELERRGGTRETQAALRHFVGVLLHGPSVRARELALGGRSAEFVSGLEALFDVQPRAVKPGNAEGIRCA